MNNDYSEEQITQFYLQAEDLLYFKKKSIDETIAALVDSGIDEEGAITIINNLEREFTVERKKRAEKDILYGALWCVGGLVATAAEIGYIFWGAILFGGIQFVRGLRNS